MQGQSGFAFETREGSQIRIFKVDQDNTFSLRELLEQAAPQHRLISSRGHSAMSSGAPATAVIDDNTWVAVLEDAGSTSVSVAVGRYFQVRDDQAEVAVVVRDDMQGRGIGSRMLYFVLDQARAAGMRSAVTSFDSSNEAAWQVLQYSPYHITWQPRGNQVDVVIHLQARASAGTTMN